MKAIITPFFLLAFLAASATDINQTIPVQKGQTIRMWFDYPNMVRVSTWDRNEISITGSVSINNGENNDAFKLDVKNSGTTISIRNRILNMDRLPQRITVHDGGKKIVFRDKSEWKKYEAEHGKSNRVSMGLDMDILIEIKVPKNMETSVESVYGFVEIKEFVGPLDVQATYGGVDATLTEGNVGELIAETNYGNIYSNLRIDIDKGTKEEDFHTLVRAHPGTGPRYKFESPYGNVYLRRIN